MHRSRTLGVTAILVLSGLLTAALPDDGLDVRRSIRDIPTVDPADPARDRPLVMFPAWTNDDGA